MTSLVPPHTVVLGGGSAGWMTACLLYKEWEAHQPRITVVESPAIGIIGVGEGSTPQLKAFFDLLGIDEAEWMKACDATYKLGIRFTGWSEAPGFESYFHPFPGPVDLHSEPGFARNCALRRRGGDVPAHPDDWFLAARLTKARKTPHPADNFPFPPSYGYHFDAHKLGGYLREWAIARGIEHRPLKAVDVEMSGDGDVAALLCEDDERIEGDFFIDCSGFASLLAQQKLGVRFISFGENLFSDSAVVMPTQHEGPLTPQTESIAMSAGWRWSIPLTSRIGNGYVYSSRHISGEDAETELRRAIGTENGDGEARFLSMKVGRIESSWTRNCLAAGLSQGFVEPLEATALHIVIDTAQQFARAFAAGDFTAKHRDRFNRSVAERYDGIRDYIVSHYRLNGRTDTKYWRENAANHALPGSLKDMMTAWYTHKDMGEALRSIYGARPAYSAMSWHCLFAGYGCFPPAEMLQPLPPHIQSADLYKTRAMLDACVVNFPDYEVR